MLVFWSCHLSSHSATCFCVFVRDRLVHKDMSKVCVCVCVCVLYRKRGKTKKNEGGNGTRHDFTIRHTHTGTYSSVRNDLAVCLYDFESARSSSFRYAVPSNRHCSLNFPDSAAMSCNL